MQMQSVQEQPLGLASTLCARLCHDFAGPLGTLAGMLELLGENAGETEPREEVELAGEAAAMMLARLRLFREAWTGGGQAHDAASIRALAAGLPGAGRMRLDLEELAPPLEPIAARLALCLLLVADQALPHGGAIALMRLHSGGLQARLSGRNAAWPASLALCAASSGTAWRETDNVRGLAVPLLCLTAASLAWHLTVEASDTLTLSPL